jgi:hypothetical protein
MFKLNYFKFNFKNSIQLKYVESYYNVEIRETMLLNSRLFLEFRKMFRIFYDGVNHEDSVDKRAGWRAIDIRAYGNQLVAKFWNFE